MTEPGLGGSSCFVMTSMNDLHVRRSFTGELPACKNRLGVDEGTAGVGRGSNYDRRQSEKCSDRGEFHDELLYLMLRVEGGFKVLEKRCERLTCEFDAMVICLL